MFKYAVIFLQLYAQNTAKKSDGWKCANYLFGIQFMCELANINRHLSDESDCGDVPNTSISIPPIGVGMFFAAYEFCDVYDVSVYSIHMHTASILPIHSGDVSIQYVTLLLPSPEIFPQEGQLEGINDFRLEVNPYRSTSV